MSVAGRFIGIPDAARISGIPERTFRRRMHAMNDIANGRLLVPAARIANSGRKTGKWLICLAVLEEIAPARAKTRAATIGDLEEVETNLADVVSRVETLERRMDGVVGRLRKHDKTIKSIVP